MYVVIGAVLIGLALGLMGSGGSILTVPVLVYLLGRDDKAAIAESLGMPERLRWSVRSPTLEAGKSIGETYSSSACPEWPEPTAGHGSRNSWPARRS